jgi:gamma-glutamyl-gamma-aminobutyrate hydrolase PuuD
VNQPSRPRIGLSTYREPAAWGVWQEPADLLPVRYSAEAAAAGAVPVLLPPACVEEEAARAVIAGVDGLVLTGGADVDPARYGADPHPRTGAPRTDRDGWELLLLHAARERRLPVLAICRGMQVLNVGLGGTLVQHLPDLVGHEGHCPVPGVHARHDVRLAPDSRIAAMLGPAATVATYHHQAVAELGDGLHATGWAEDGVVEAVELADGWVVGVQWHPEVHDGARLFAGFVAACAAGSG